MDAAILDKIFQNCFSFRGRINRWPFFWKQVLTNLVVSALGNGLASVTGVEFFTMAAAFVMYLAQLSFFVRRLHDLNRSAIWVLLPLALAGLAAYNMATGNTLALDAAMFVYLAFTCYILFWKGTAGPNAYGADPLAKPDAR